MSRTWSIRPLQASDNPAIAAVIRQVMPEFGADGPGFALHDPEVDDMFGTYSQSGSAYFVVVAEGRVVGGAGYGQLANYQADDAGPVQGAVCELRKMYFLPEIRGAGAATALLQLCLEQAYVDGYRYCYLETLSHMSVARALYQRFGFQRLDAAMGNTGHFGCNSFYGRVLEPISISG